MVQNNWQRYGQVMQFAVDKLQDLSNIEFRIYSTIARKTFGYNQTSARISITDLDHIAKNKAVIKALKSLQEKNLIKRIKGQELGPKQAYEYSIVFRQDLGMPYIQLGLSKKQLKEQFEKAFDDWYSKLPIDSSIRKLNLIDKYNYFRKEVYENIKS
jgi:phage replication O-like protein O